ncbi:MAG: hypothetical protein HY695_36030 [Deltaproteobacteria bacterium]|nr:hypothetical protein [Deltaproteobacteria bacterium]
MLHVDGSPEFVGQVRGALEHIDPTAMVMDRAVCFDTGRSFERHPRGHELLRRLVESGYRVVIIRGTSSRCEPTYPNGMRTGSTVVWNFGQVPTNAPACFCIGLGHELGHADQLIRGVVGAADLYPAGGGSSGFSMRLEMLNITGRYGVETWDGVTENQLRDEHVPRQAARPSY